MNDNRPLVVAIGEVLWDVFGNDARLGGAPANFAVHAAALGLRSALVSCVGNDVLGQRAVSELKNRGVGVDGVLAHAQCPTGTVLVTLKDGQPSYDIVDSVAWDFIGWHDALAVLARSADVICFGTLAQRSVDSRATIQRFLQVANPNCMRVLDVNFRQAYHSKSVVEDALDLANVVKLNDAEVPLLQDYLGGSNNVDVFLKDLCARFGLRYVVLTLGGDGCRIFHTKGEVVSKGDAQVVVNAVGAGDAFTAAFVGAVVSGEDVKASADLANAVGGYVVTQDSATPPLPEQFRIFS